MSHTAMRRCERKRLGGRQSAAMGRVTGEGKTRALGASFEIEAFVLSPDGKTLASTDYDDIRLWDAARGRRGGRSKPRKVSPVSHSVRTARR